MLNWLEIIEIKWKPVDCLFLLAEELYRIPCLSIFCAFSGRKTAYFIAI